MATVPALGTDVADGELLMRLSTPWAEFARHPVPDLCEVWGWEGDTSVLPFRWHELRQQHVAAAPDMPDMSREQFVDMYVNSRAFSPSDFFIITSRSSPVGSAIVTFPRPGVAHVRHVLVDPRKHSQATRAALLSLCMERIASADAGVHEVWVSASPADPLHVEAMLALGFRPMPRTPAERDAWQALCPPA